MQTQTADTAARKHDKPMHLTKKIGSTTYVVSIHYSQTSRETAEDKILRLIEEELSNQKSSKK